jgi:hypothetical protein
MIKSTFEACMIFEGVDDGDQIEALQFLIDTGAVWSLQGMYGRAAAEAIESGICCA